MNQRKNKQTAMSSMYLKKNEDYRCFNFLLFVCHTLFNFFACSMETDFTKT